MGESIHIVLDETAMVAAMPTPELPNGAVVATTDISRWDHRPVRLLDLNP
ncbi:hypothetical protein KGQ20_45445 [Catenulispora sp. NF23]|uniref:Uncharacterized protein n=1 Tax=Catenulispora pinistramenti TaxID=2705254 RepID=A0ABS5L178_9ACTN|nr:hypothetical protein [Catenulispora pinistramenti]MBS2540012.1 hypothetical protein [Catenulispora pinistramenti]MBS2551939.1 hypothetical protein [Catenulispora pinistramenti]